MYQYLDLLQRVLEEGVPRENRTGVKTLSLFHATMEFDLQAGFPAVTTKKLAFRQVVGELIAFLRGYDNVEQFKSVGCDVWDANANAEYWINNPHRQGEGDLGRIYGVQWRRWEAAEFSYQTFPFESERGLGLTVNASVRYIDQLADLIERIKRDPNDRRLIVSAWNPGDLPKMALPPCHVMFQCYVSGSSLDMAMYQRSADLFLGVPFNIASYALLNHLIARETGLEPGRLVIILGDAHIYESHVDQVEEQIRREPYPLPRLAIADVAPRGNLEAYQPWHFGLEGYEHHPAIKAEMVV